MRQPTCRHPPADEQTAGLGNMPLKRSIQGPGLGRPGPSSLRAADASTNIDPARPWTPRGRDPAPHDAAAIAAIAAVIGSANEGARAAPPPAPMMVLVPPPGRSRSWRERGGAECCRCDDRESK